MRHNITIRIDVGVDSVISNPGSLSEPYMKATPEAATTAVKSVNSEVASCTRSDDCVEKKRARQQQNRPTRVEAIQILLWIMRTCRLRTSQRCTMTRRIGHRFTCASWIGASIFAQTWSKIFRDGSGSAATAHRAVSLSASQVESSAWHVSQCRRCSRTRSAIKGSSFLFTYSGKSSLT